MVDRIGCDCHFYVRTIHSNTPKWVKKTVVTCVHVLKLGSVMNGIGGKGERIVGIMGDYNVCQECAATVKNVAFYNL